MTHPTPPGALPRHAPDQVSILLADPHAIVREGLKALLAAHADLRVVGEAGNGSDAVRFAAELSPDLVVTEACLLDVADRLRSRSRVLVLTGCDDGGSLQRALAAGVAGYVLKRATAEQVVGAVRAVVSGGTYIDPEMAGGLVGGFANPQEQVELSERESQVLRMIALGYSNKEIAARLSLSVKTVETYKSRTMDKLNTHSRVELVRYAVTQGWLTASSAVAEARAVH